MTLMAWAPGGALAGRLDCLPPRQTIPYAATSRSWLSLTTLPTIPV
jgi:hypothetical protein